MMFNKETFSNILKKINASYETMTEFAKKAEFDRTYISKYINQKLDNPPTPKILEKIAKASNGITSYTELMEICGYIDLHSVFLQTHNKENTNLCYWNEQELIDIGFSQDDVEELSYLSNSNIPDRSKRISNILDKYPDNLLKKFYDKAITQTELNLKQNIEIEDLRQKLIQLIENNEALLKESNNFRYASQNGINIDGLDENEIEEVNRFVEFIRNKKKSKED